MIDMCLVCRRRDAPTCGGCRARMHDQLGALPGLLTRLPHALVPGQGGGERVSASREAPLPLRLDALSLAAGGSDMAGCVFVPKVRVWTSIEDVDGTPVTMWHREPVLDARGRPLMALADDQAGALPVGTWLASWVADWRRTFDHRELADTPRVPVPDRLPPPALSMAERARVLLGLGPALQPADRPADPLAEEWEVRFERAAPYGLARRHRYLTAWLDHAADHHPRIGDFAASLRTLVGALRAALGDTDDLEYLGRCPETWSDVAGGRVVCGAALWHDPYVDKILCPRCRTETGHERRLWLARRILDEWPIDRRRRYPRGLIDTLRLPTCHCGETIDVHWVEATERQDRERFWRPGRVTCPAGCGVEAA